MRRIMITGNLTKDAENKNINGSNAILFTVAVNEKYKDRNNIEVKTTFYYDCNLWSDNNTIKDLLKRGNKVYAEGQPDLNIYLDKENKPKGGIRIRVEKFEVFTFNKNDGSEATQNTTQNTSSNQDSDNLPF